MANVMHGVAYLFGCHQTYDNITDTERVDGGITPFWYRLNIIIAYNNVCHPSVAKPSHAAGKTLITN